jgi:hypothetical protein
VAAVAGAAGVVASPGLAAGAFAAGAFAVVGLAAGVVAGAEDLPALMNTAIATPTPPAITSRGTMMRSNRLGF